MSNKNRRPWYKRYIGIIVTIVLAIIGWYIYAHYASTPDFSISVNPMQGSVQQGGVIQTTITVKGIGRYKHPVSLSASGQPSDIVITFIPPIGGPTPAYTSTVTTSVASNAAVDDYTIIIKGTGADGKEHSCIYTLIVKPMPVTSTPTLKITYPLSGDIVEIKEIVRGTSQNIPKEQAIWIVIYPHEVSRYYPQDYPANVQANGDWSSSAFIGIEIDVRKKFDIIAVLADKEAQDAFNDYLEECREEQSWRGLERLHGGAVIYDRITVIRK